MTTENKVRVLLVEDVDILRSTLRDYLMDEGFTVSTAGKCATARAIAMSDHPDVIVSDVRLPDGSGFDLCDDLRRAKPALKIVMMSGFPHHPIPEWIYENKIPLLGKPLDLLGLADTIRESVASG